MASPITLKNRHLSLQIHPLGAALIGVWVADHPDNLVLGFDDPGDHHRIPICAGHIVGPVANRIARGEVEIGGRLYQMPRNENGVTALHSGPEGLHRRLWDVMAQTDTALTLRCLLPDGACGLPGHREVSATYALDGNAYTLTLQATSDAPTVMNLAAHPYWTLDDRGRVDSHVLRVAADHYLPVDATNLPTGARAPVAGTVFDFTTPRPVPHDPALDVNFCLIGDGGLAPAARVTGATGITLEIETTAPGLQVYNGSALPVMVTGLDRPGGLRPFGAIALEPQHFPNAPHHPDFPSILLHPGDMYRQVTRYTLSQAET